MAVTLDEFCSRLAHLRVDRSGGLTKPYKPLLVAAVVILIHKGKQVTRNVFLDGGLRSAFCRFPRSIVIHRPVLTSVAARRELNAGGVAR